MSDTGPTTGSQGVEKAKPIDPGHPDRNFPVVFVDGITGISWGTGVVKFYFFRTDPEFHAAHGPINNPVVQMVMPIDSFIAVSVFFRKAIETLKENNVISQAQIDLAEAAWGKPSGQ